MNTSKRLPNEGKIFSAYRPDHPRPEFIPEGPSLTRQEFAADCDINTLMARYEKTGVISHINQREPVYMDLTTQPADLQHAMEIVMAAETAFMSLPATVRREFDNDPLAFAAYAADPANLERMREWGLAEPAEKAAEPLAVRVVADPPAAGAVAPGAAAADPT